MNVGAYTFMFAEVLIPDATAMACGAITSCRGRLLKNVAIDETAANSIGLTDMAIPARRVTASAVVAKHLR